MAQQKLIAPNVREYPTEWTLYDEGKQKQDAQPYRSNVYAPARPIPVQSEPVNRPPEKLAKHAGAA